MIPLWNHQGIIPPIDESDPTSPERAPYTTDIIGVVERFASSVERCAILEGFLAHRAEMHRLGIVSGVQWLDGSFMENVELLEARAPNDMDVVTFADVSAEAEQALRPEDVNLLTNNPWIKEHYKIDFYIVLLSSPPQVLIEIAAYWYSMWSHRRSQQWKGFLSISLDPSSDARAVELLELCKREVQHEQN